MQRARASLAYALSNFACAPLDGGQVILSIFEDRIFAPLPHRRLAADNRSRRRRRGRSVHRLWRRWRWSRGRNRGARREQRRGNQDGNQRGIAQLPARGQFFGNVGHSLSSTVERLAKYVNRKAIDSNE